MARAQRRAASVVSAYHRKGTRISWGEYRALNRQVALARKALGRLRANGRLHPHEVALLEDELETVETELLDAAPPPTTPMGLPPGLICRLPASPGWIGRYRLEKMLPHLEALARSPCPHPEVTRILRPRVEALLASPEVARQPDGRTLQARARILWLEILRKARAYTKAQPTQTCRPPRPKNSTPF